MSTLPTDPLFPSQWHLDKSGTPNVFIDLNVLKVWEEYTGRGVHVGVFDSRTQDTHPDLAANYDRSRHVDGLDYAFLYSGHGTAVAGLIGAAVNGLGTVGIAHGASITGVPVIFTGSIHMASHAIAMAAAHTFDVVNMSYGSTIAFDIHIDATTWAEIAPHYTQALVAGRDGLGTVMVGAAGNHRDGFSSANLGRFQAERGVIITAAVGPDGNLSDYSAEGTNVFIAAPSNGNYFSPYITTTDLVGIDGYNDGINATWDPVPIDYTARFGGTSAAAPMVSGVLALMLEANPQLGWRDVREILAITARHTGTTIGTAPNYLEKSGWDVIDVPTVNGSGYHFSINYGFGVVDALAAVRLSESWEKQQTSANELSQSASFSGALTIPPNPTEAATMTFTLGSGVIAESVTLFADITHGRARDIELTLISPSGTRSVLFSHDSEPPSIYGMAPRFRPWTFVSNAFFGENSAGDWRVEVTGGLIAPNVSVVNALRLDVFGEAVSDDNVWCYTNEFGKLQGMTYHSQLRDLQGDDTLNAAAVTPDVLVSLMPGSASQINGKALVIPADTTIEHAFSGDGNDRIIGNSVDNHLVSGRGHDFLDGRHGHDTLLGGAGNDSLMGGAGNDILDGGVGIDTAIYTTATAAVWVDLSLLATQQTQGAGRDWLINIENVHGSAQNDRIFGNAVANVLTGGLGNDSLSGKAGNDILMGGPGSDSLHGGDGLDWAMYTHSPAGVTVDLTTGLGSGADATGDRLMMVENLRGSTHADSLTGNQSDNIFIGLHGPDSLTGGAGRDMFRYESIVDSPLNAPDWILGFLCRAQAATATTKSDILDFSSIDAISGNSVSNDVFSFLGNAEITQLGQIRTRSHGQHTLVEANILGDTVPELQITLADTAIANHLRATDFIL